MNSLRPAGIKYFAIAATLTLIAGIGFCAERSILKTAPETVDPATIVPPGMTFIPAIQDYQVGLSLEQIEAIQERIKLSSPTELAVFAAAYPLNTVNIESFYLDTQEVTQRDWMAYLKATGKKPGEHLVRELWTDGEIPEGKEDHPITFISRDEAEEYTLWCGKRLPTEIEWEYAARGPNAFVYPWGNDFDDPDPRWDANGRRIPGKEVDPDSLKKGGDRANCGPSRGKREPNAVGKYPLGNSPFGLQDMAGNVWEWTSSQMLAYPDHKPFTLKTHFGKEEISGASLFSSSEAIIRGGSYDRGESALMSVIRQPTSPKTWNSSVGFRCAKSARAGVETLHQAVRELGQHRFGRLSPLDEQGLAAAERTTYQDDGTFTSYEGILFCQVSEWKESSGRTLGLSKAEKEPQLALGAFTTTHDCFVPPIPAGTYYVELRPANTKAKVDKSLKFPKTGWYYHGFEPADDRSSKRGAKDEDDPADDAEEEGAKDDAAGGDEDEDEGPTIIEMVGSLKLNPKVHNVILMNTKGQVVAAYPIDRLKEDGKLEKDGEPPAVALSRGKMIKVDKRANLPETEIWTFDWIVKTSQRKGVSFSLPFRFAPDLLSATKTALSSEKGKATVEAEAPASKSK